MLCTLQAPLWISIHALRVEGDCFSPWLCLSRSVFLSTPSGWRATLTPRLSGGKIGFLSTPSGWRATYYCMMILAIYAVFLSTPSGWRATERGYMLTTFSKFLSTPSGWRATRLCSSSDISSRFLSTPSGWRATRFELWARHGERDFYPRPPGGGRR